MWFSYGSERSSSLPGLASRCAALSWHRGYLVAVWLCLASCALRHKGIFEVVHHNAAAVLRDPGGNVTPFADILRSYNGFQRADPFIDLRPLMQIRVENAYYEKGSSRKGLSGYLGTEVAHYEVEATGLRLLSVQSMQSRPSIDAAVQDLISPAVQHAQVFRFYYEIFFHDADRTRGSVLLAANSRDEMNRLAAQLKNPELVCHAGSAHCSVFPDACSVSTEMTVHVNGEAATVLWGSTLSDVAGENARRATVKRVWKNKLLPVKINRKDSGALQLPLLPGDTVSWR